MKSLRVLVLGSSCAGKSTLARKLSKWHGLPCIALDLIHFEPGFRPKNNEQRMRDLVRALESESWVAEGILDYQVEHALTRCTHLIWLRSSRVKGIYRYFKRALIGDRQLRGVLNFSMMKWVVGYEQRERHGLASHQKLFDGFGGSKMLLESSDNPAHELYRRLGF